MTTIQTGEDILRPLAEATVECPTGEHPGVEHEGLDPRFEALRCPPLRYCHDGIHADLGAIVQAAADYGLIWVLFTPGACLMRGQRTEYSGMGATPTEAAARALVAAWRDGKAASQIAEKA